MPQVMNGKQIAHRNITVMTCKTTDMFILKLAPYKMFEAFFGEVSSRLDLYPPSRRYLFIFQLLLFKRKDYIGVRLLSMFVLVGTINKGHQVTNDV